jgi:hypothetical protein
VKLDATISTMLTASSDIWGFTIKFELKRNNGITDTILSTDYVSGGYHQTGTIPTQSYFWQPNFTFVDIPGAAKTYTYRIDATVQFIQNALAKVTNRGFTATIY